MYRHHFCVLWMAISLYSAFFFFNDTATTEIYTLSLHDALPISCGAGLSVQQQGFNQTPVLIENCVFLRNRAQGTGAAIDLLAGSSARIINCLFVGNVSNTGEDVVAKNSGERPFVNNGVLTIFWNSGAEV